MLVIAHLAVDAFTHPRSMATLGALAAAHDLVLICPNLPMADIAIPVLRRTFPRRSIVGLLATGAVADSERRLIRDLLDDGKLPLIVTGESAPGHWDWLDADEILTLPADAARAEHRSIR